MSIQDAVNAIIRPFRSKYEIERLPTTLETDDEEDGGGIFFRQPIVIETPRRLKIRGSMYFTGTMRINKPGPCVVYLHGNSSNQLEGQFLVPNFTPQKIFVFCFDFAGCGCSDGEYVSLGHFEKADLDYVLDFLRNTYGFGPFILWGRSMGAATALLIENEHVKGIISDSAFTSIRSLVKSIALQKGVGKILLKPALWLLRKKIIEQAGFDINDVKPLDSCKIREIPIRFAHSIDDQLIPFSQCKELYDNYKGSNKGDIIRLTGGHNGRRPPGFFRDGVIFTLSVLGLPVKGVVISPCRRLLKSEFHFECYDSLVEVTKNNIDVEKLRREVMRSTMGNSSGGRKPSSHDKKGGEKVVNTITGKQRHEHTVSASTEQLNETTEESTEQVYGCAAEESMEQAYGFAAEESMEQAYGFAAEESTEQAYGFAAEESTEQAYECAAEESMEQAYGCEAEESTEQAYGCEAEESTEQAYECAVGESTEHAYKFASNEEYFDDSECGNVDI